MHLNAPFRDPLPPIDDGGITARAVEGIDWERFFRTLDRRASVRCIRRCRG